MSEGARFKRGEKIAARIDSPGGELESCLRQSGGHEIGVDRVVF